MQFEHQRMSRTQFTSIATVSKTWYIFIRCVKLFSHFDWFLYTYDQQEDRCTGGIINIFYDIKK